MRTAEQRAIDSGRSEADLMRDAAARMAEWINNRHVGGDDPSHVFALAGPGRNGGDAIVTVANLIERGWTGSVYLVDRSDFGDLPADSSSLEAIDRVSDATDVSSAAVILDGIFGFGGRAELPESASDAIAAVVDARRLHRIPIVAIDLPSGVDAATGEASDNALHADVTLTIGFLKQGLLNEPAATLAGAVEVINIGLATPDDASIAVVTQEMVSSWFPRRRATAGKHDHGGLLVIGGAPMYFGAPRLAAEAALRVGAGLVGAAVPRMLVGTIASQLPEVVFVPLSDSDPRRSVNDLNDAITGEHARYTAVVLGPGLGQDEPATALLARLFGQASSRSVAPIGFGALRTDEDDPAPEESALAAVPVVLDADALNWLATQENWPSLLANISAVMTPHRGEMARLLGVDVDEIARDPRETARAAAETWGQVVVLKGGYTTVADPDGRVFVAPRATPELATPGTGDVLAGVIGGFLAQGLEPIHAALAGVFIGAETGDRVQRSFGRRGFLARDLITRIQGFWHDIDEPDWWM
jgi:NAD(P)H-hydrate epimerase